MTAVRPYENEMPRIGEKVYIDPQSAVIGKVVLGDDASVWPFAVIRGDVNHIEIGARTNIQDGAICHVTHDGPFTPGGFPLIVGDDVTVGHGAILHACTVGQGCLIGMNATVLDGAEIGDWSMIGAGSVVPPGKKVESGTLWLGNPARLLRKLSEREIEQLKYSAEHYVRLKNRYLDSA